MRFLVTCACRPKLAAGHTNTESYGILSGEFTARDCTLVGLINRRIELCSYRIEVLNVSDHQGPVLLSA